MSNISEKQKELELLKKQMESLQQDLQVLEEKNPEYKKTFEGLRFHREEIEQFTQKVEKVTFPNFIEFECKWGGIGYCPEIMDSKFLCENSLKEYFQVLFFEYGEIDSIFEFNIPEINIVLNKFENYDQEVEDFNKKVNKAFDKFQEEQLKTLLF